MRPSVLDATLVHVRLRDESVLPDIDELRSSIDLILVDHPTARRLRTAALFPRAAERFAEAGFELADSLMLLRADLTRRSVRDYAARRRNAPTRSLGRRHFAEAAAVDRAAFGDDWGHDAAEIDDICAATPVHRARRRSGNSVPRVVAFAIAGASSEHGYLQRLAVDPAHSRRGHGRALTADALRWMIRRRLPDCLVNTSVHNTAAQALYIAAGFDSMSERLNVFHLDVAA